MVVISRMYKLVNVRMAFCMKMVYSVLFIFYDSYGFFSEVLDFFCSSVKFSAPRATISNLTREEKRAWYAIVVVFC